MANSENINQQLASKFYLFSIGLYAAVGSVFGCLFLLQYALGLNPLICISLSYFITVLWRSFYDQLIIYKVKFEHIKIKNNLTLALISSCILAALYYFVRAPLGDWAIPITVIISMKIIAQLKEFLWPNATAKLSDFFKVYTGKLQVYLRGLYGFFFIVAFITYQITKIYSLKSFCIAFAIGIFLGLIFEQLYDFAIVYKIKLTYILIGIAIALAAISSIFCTGLFIILMQILGLSGKAATIISVVLLKLIQTPITNLRLKN